MRTAAAAHPFYTKTMKGLARRRPEAPICLLTSAPFVLVSTVIAAAVADSSLTRISSSHSDR